jgi:electron transfer flavoprotein beta subunit
VKIGVCLKQVPATDSRIQINGDASGIVTQDVKWEINPYDEFALEAALQLLDAGVASDVVIVTAGDKSCEQRIRDGLARGAKEAIRLEDAAFEGSDALGTARILAAALKSAGVDLVLCGKQAVDDDASQLPAMIAEILDCAQICVVDDLNVEGTKVTARRSMAGGTSHVVSAELPAVITCDKGLNTPRFSSLKGIMMAKRKKITVMGAGDIGLDPSTVGAGAALVKESSFSLPPARPSGRIIEGDSVEGKVKELVRLLRDEAKVI